MNTFLMFIGVPGQGKTTFINDNQFAITSQYGVDAVISSDAVIEDIAVSRGLTYTEVFHDSIALAGKYIEAMMGILSLQQRSFILDQTNLTKKTRQRKLGLLVHPQNYHKIAVVFNEVKDQELTNRLTTRNETGKIITPELVKSMSDSFQYPTLDEGFNKIMTVQEFKDMLPSAVSNTLPKYGEMKFN